MAIFLRLRAASRYSASSVGSLASRPSFGREEVPSLSRVMEESARLSTREMRVPSVSSITARANLCSSSPAVPISQSPFIRKWTTIVSPLSSASSWCLPRRSMPSMRFPFARRARAAGSFRFRAGWMARTEAIVFPSAARLRRRDAASTSGSSGKLDRHLIAFSRESSPA